MRGRDGTEGAAWVGEQDAGLGGAEELDAPHGQERPEVDAAGAVTFALPTGAGGQRQLTLPAQNYAPLAGNVRRGIEAVTPGYFRALGVKLVAGRTFERNDRHARQPF